MITHLKDNEIFVFGSNTSGRHGRGAAKQACSSFGAKWGIGEGVTGQAYAFPTLDWKFKRRTLEELLVSTDLLYAACNENPEKKFLLTKVGCGLAGFEESAMRRLFSGDRPANLILPEDWR